MAAVHRALTLGALLAVGAPAMAQPVAASTASSTFLDALRARADLRQAATELGRASALRARAMLSPSEYDERLAAWERARIAHLGALVAASGARMHVAIVRAVKERRADGRLRVALTLRNDASRATVATVARRSGAPLDDMPPSSGSRLPDDLLDRLVDRQLGEAAYDDSAALAEWSTVRGAVVALKADPGANGVTISRPYERTLPDLRAGEATTVVFDLLEDVTDVVVSLDVAGRSEERRIRLEVGSAERGIAIDAAQFALEGELGTQITYDLRLRRPRPSAAPVRLDVGELPSEIAYEFREVAGGKRLRQLRFADGATVASVQLVLSLPDRPSSAIPVERPLAFIVAAVDATESAASGATDAARGARTVGHGSVRLELLPRGVARLEVRPAALTLDAAVGRPSVLAVTVRNAGSGRVENVRLRVEPPARWQVTSTPAVVPRLAPGDEARVELRVDPAADATVGDYELRLGVDDGGSTRRVDVDDKLIRLHLAGAGGTATPAALGVLAVALTIGLFTHGRRWLNR